MVAPYPDLRTLTAMGGSADIYQTIIDSLETNGDLEQKEVNRLVLLALVDLGVGRLDARICRHEIEVVDERVKKIEKYSILFLANRHPKTAIAIIAIIVLFNITVISRLELWNWIIAIVNEYTGVPLP